MIDPLIQNIPLTLFSHFCIFYFFHLGGVALTEINRYQNEQGLYNNVDEIKLDFI